MLRNKFDDTEVRFAKCLGIDSIMLNTYAWRHKCSCSNVCHRQRKVDIMIINVRVIQYTQYINFPEAQHITVQMKGCITSIAVCGKYESCTGNWYTWSYASCISRTRGRCRRRWAANLLAPRKSWTTFQSLRIAMARRRNESLMRSSHISKYRFVNQYS